MSFTGRSGHSPARAEEPANSADAVKPRKSRRRMPISEPSQQSTAVLKPIFTTIVAKGNPPTDQSGRPVGAIAVAYAPAALFKLRSEERRVGKECRWRWLAE